MGEEPKKWYVRSTQGKVFGPIGPDTLLEWVRDGRVEPFAGLSQDLRNWMLAPMLRELEMDWIVENEPGQFYGPTHRAVVDDLVKAGTLSKGARFYRDNRVQEDECRRKSEAALSAQAAAFATREAAFASQRAETAAALNAKEAELAKMVKRQEELAAALSESERKLEECRLKLEESETKRAQAEKALAERAEPPAREWCTPEVVEPEVVVAGEMPPNTARQAFGGVSMAELERQAQRELARMSATGGGRKLFKFGR